MTLFIVILLFVAMVLIICYLASSRKKETALEVKKEGLPAIPPEPIIIPPPQTPAPPQEPTPPVAPPPPEGPGF